MAYDINLPFPLPPDQLQAIMGQQPQVQPVSAGQLMPDAQQDPNSGIIRETYNNFVKRKQDELSQNGLLSSILTGRFQQPSSQPTLSDISRSITQTQQAFGAPDLFKPATPDQIAQTRVSNEQFPVTNQLGLMNQASDVIKNVKMAKNMGGGTGELIDRLMQENPNMPFRDALYQVQTGMRQGLQLDANGNIIPMSGAIPSIAALSGAKEQGQQAVDLAYKPAIAGGEAQQKANVELGTSAGIAAAKKIGEQKAENQQVGAASQDITGLYGKLIQDARTAPSGVLSDKAARIANAVNMPTQGSIAQGQFDADLNNLYLATIRSLKGTGRVMEQELNKIAESAPRASDSMEVKIAKAQAHMAYYNQRMKSLGYDPTQALNDNQQSTANSTGATHIYNPQTGQLEVVQ